MNNIDILEEFCKIKINSYAIKFVNISYPELQQAIETLIAENKELKEEKLKKSGIYEFNVNIEDDYIPKSKVEEVIEEVKKDENPSISSFQEYAQEYAIDKLQSLLGKE